MTDQYRMHGVVDAVRVLYENLDKVQWFVPGAEVFVSDDDNKLIWVQIPGKRRAYPGDWLIKDNHGAVHPISDWVFEALFERVEEND